MNHHPCVNQNEIRMIGMSRSGNHAILQWLMQQLPSRVCFLNCVEGKSNPFQTARVMDDGQICHANFPEFDLASEQHGYFSPKDWLIFNHEDGFLGRSCSAEYERHHDEWVGPSRRRVDVLILRDPFNLFASRRRCLWGFLTPRTTVKIWKQHAREFLGVTRRLRHNPLRISYNRWRMAEACRRGITDHLGVEFDDSRFLRVVPCNRGSSFDGTIFDGRAHEMKVLERWKHYENEPEFRAMFDEELFELSERIFGRIPGTERLLARAHRSSNRLGLPSRGSATVKVC